MIACSISPHPNQRMRKPNKALRSRSLLVTVSEDYVSKPWWRSTCFTVSRPGFPKKTKKEQGFVEEMTLREWPGLFSSLKKAPGFLWLKASLSGPLWTPLRKGQFYQRTFAFNSLRIHLSCLSPIAQWAFLMFSYLIFSKRRWSRSGDSGFRIPGSFPNWCCQSEKGHWVTRTRPVNTFLRLRCRN